MRRRRNEYSNENGETLMEFSVENDLKLCPHFFNLRIFIKDYIGW